MTSVARELGEIRPGRSWTSELIERKARDLASTDARAERVRLRRRIDDLGEENETLQSTLSRLKDENAALRQQLADKEQELKNLGKKKDLAMAVVKRYSTAYGLVPPVKLDDKS
jgi:septal ring factor EnvC (AmiA/AmiB activator)